MKGFRITLEVIGRFFVSIGTAIGLDTIIGKNELGTIIIAGIILLLWVLSPIYDVLSEEDK